MAQPVVSLHTLPSVVPGTQRLATLAAVRDCAFRKGEDGDEWCKFLVNVNDPNYYTVNTRVPVRFTFQDGSGVDDFHEWRVDNIVREMGLESNWATVTARSYLFDLVDSGAVAMYGAGGAKTYKFDAVAKTPVQWLDDVILPHLVRKGYTHFSRGTVDFTETETLTFTRYTCAKILNDLISRQGGVVRLRRTGSSIAIDWTVAVTANTVRVFLGKNLHEHRLTEYASDQATAVLPIGGKYSQVDNFASLAGTGWKVTAVNAGSRLLTLAAVDGNVNTKAIHVDAQFTGKYVRRRMGNGTILVTDTIEATQQLQLEYIDSCAVGDVLEFHDTPGDQTLSGRSYARHIAGSWELLKISAVASNLLTYDTPFAATTFVDDYLNDATINGLSQVTQVTVTYQNVATQQYTCTSTAALAVGQLALVTTNNTGALNVVSISQIVSIDTANIFTVAPYYPHRTTQVIGSTGSVTYYLRALARRPGTTQVRKDTGGATKTLLVQNNAAAAIAVNDYVEVWSAPGGESVTELVHPVYAQDIPSGYGLKSLEYVRDDMGGGSNLLSEKDPALDDWVSGTTMNVWTRVSGSLSTRTDNATIGGLYGTYSCLLRTSLLRSGIFGIPWRPGARQFTVVMRVKTSNSANWVGADATNYGLVSVAYGYVSANNVYNAQTGGAVWGTNGSVPTGSMTQVGVLDPDTWYDLVATFDFSSLAYPGMSQFQIQINSSRGGTGIGDVYIDAVAVYLGADAAMGGIYTLTDDKATLWDKGGRYMLAWAPPPTTHAVRVSDLQRMFPGVFSADQFDIGTQILLENPALLVTGESVRVIGMETRWTPDGEVDVELTLNTLQQDFTRYLAQLT